MPLVTPLTDYTDKDFDSLRFRLRNLVRSVFPEWSDFNVANFGNILLELYAHVGDVLLYYQDNQARQSRIVTATQRKALLGLVKLIGYTPSSATPATADVVFTLGAATAGDVVLPAGTFVLTEEVTTPIKYQLLADVTIPAGSTTATASVENSETSEETFASSGLPNQTFSLSNTPYIDGTSIVLAGNGAYTQVDNFLSSLPTDRHFTVTVDQNDRAQLRFPNGVNGAVPVGTISVTYKTGGGAAGRVEANKLTRVEGNFTDTFGNSVTVTANNPAASSGGTDRQTVAQIKERAPATVRVQNRTVSREDFEINALRLPAVARALMLTSNEDATIDENNGVLYIIAAGGGTPSQELLDQALEQVTVVYPSTLTFAVETRAPTFRDINVTAKIFFKQGVVKTTVAANVRAALTQFFVIQNPDGTTNTNIDFGAKLTDDEGNVTGELALSDIFNVVRDVAGVRKIGTDPGDFLLNDAYDDVVLGLSEFPRLGSVILFDGDTGLQV